MNMTKIAKLAGVSQATVSRVINEQPGVSSETVREVMRVIKEMGYQPRGRANKRNLGGIRTGLVAMVASMVDVIQHSELFTRTLFGASQALGERGVKLVLVQRLQNGEFVPAVKLGSVDGVLVVGGCTESQIRENFGNVPMVWLTSHSDVTGDHVLAGNEAVGQLAAEYLHRKGARNLVFFNPDPSFAVYRSRGAAFRLKAEELNTQSIMISNDTEGLISRWGVNKKELSVSLEKMADEFVSLGLESAGIFVPDDSVTSLLYPILYEKGIKPVTEVPVISCCNEQPYLSGLNPKPATIDLGHQLIGHRAVEQLFWRIRHPQLEDNRPFQVTISPVLVG